MINPITEVQAFVRASLVDPVPRDHTEPDAAFRRRRVVVVVTLLAGAAVLTWALRIEPGDSLFLVAVITAINGIAEELYFRGALYAGVGRRHAVLVTTVVYALVVATSGIPLLVLAAAVVGLVVGLQRRVTGGILGPIITHLTWSLGMLFLLPAALGAFS